VSRPNRNPVTAAALVLLLSLAAPCVLAQAPRPAPAQQQDQGGPSWATLTPAQRSALAPLERDWAGIDAPRKQKWLDIAARMPKMPADERQRVQQRMHEWTKLSPQERGQARLHYQEARQITPQERQQRWEAYQALPPEQRQQLADRAKPVKPAASKNGAREAAPKSNLVPNPADAARPRAVGPTVVQGKPGATTTLITKQPAPPAHQQTGLPKIAATPDFVDRTTLLPQKGPQGAATRAVTPASAPQPHRP
jgi:hypothetical protein